jgi:hypothetical protein
MIYARPNFCIVQSKNNDMMVWRSLLLTFFLALNSRSFAFALSKGEKEKAQHGYTLNKHFPANTEGIGS